MDEWLTAYALLAYLTPVLLVFGVLTWIAEVIERRNPPKNRKL